MKPENAKVFWLWYSAELLETSTRVFNRLPVMDKAPAPDDEIVMPLNMVKLTPEFVSGLISAKLYMFE